MRLQTLTNHLFIILTFIVGNPAFALGKGDPIDLSSATVRIDFPGATCPNVHMIRMPFQLINRLIAVDAQIGNVTGKLILDTGAEKLLLNISYFNTTALQPTRSWLGVIGDPKTVFHVKIEQFYLDQYLLTEHEVHLMNLSHIEKKRKVKLLGILGYEILKDFEMMIDYASQTLVFTKVNHKGVPLVSSEKKIQIQDSVKFMLFKHFIIVRPEVDGARLLMALDTGAEYNLLDIGVRKKVLEHFEPGVLMNLTGVSNQEAKVQSGRLGGLNCGPYEDLEMRTILMNMQLVWKSIGIKIHGILGYEFLKDKKVLINYKKRKLYFLRSK